MAFRYDWDDFEEWCENNNGRATKSTVDDDGETFYGTPNSHGTESVRVRAVCEFEEADEKFVMMSKSVDVDEQARRTGNELGSDVGENSRPGNLDNFNVEDVKRIVDGEVVEVGDGGVTYFSGRSSDDTELIVGGVTDGTRFHAPDFEIDDWTCTYRVSTYAGEIEVENEEEAKRIAVEQAEEDREHAMEEGVTQQKGGLGSQPYKAAGHYFLQDLELIDVDCEPA